MAVFIEWENEALQTWIIKQYIRDVSSQTFRVSPFFWSDNSWPCASGWWEQSIHGDKNKKHFHLVLSYASAAATTLLIVKYKRIDDIKYEWMYILCDYE